MADFGQFRGFGDKLFQGQLPTNLGKIGSEAFGFDFLLDLYPNAAAAYSLRKLQSAYIGSAIRVRRSSDNDEQDIGFVVSGLDYVLDTSSLTSFCGSGNGFVTTWYDQSGNARNATQTTAANQPQIVNSGSVILNNSKPAVRFIAANQTKLTTSSYTLTNPIRHFAYFNFNNSADGFVFDGATVNQYRIYAETFTKLTLYMPSVITAYNDVTGVTNKNYLSDSLANDSSSSWQLNNNSPITFSLGSTTTTGLTLGTTGSGFTGFFYNGFIHEFVSYNSTQSSNASGIRNNINTYYGIY
jgi:hypothetical protein